MPGLLPQRRGLGQGLLQLRLQRGAVFGAEAAVHEADAAVGADQHAGGHALDGVAPGRLALGVESHGEAGRHLGQEALGVRRAGIDIDAHHLQAARPQLGLDLVHPGKDWRHGPHQEAQKSR
jgi:hypothetical protein